MTIKDPQRIEMLLDAIHLTANELSIKLNYSSPSAVYHILNGINNISEGFISRVLQKYPNVNYFFLKNGEEPVLVDQPQGARKLVSPDVAFEDVPQLLKNIEVLLVSINQKLDNLNQES